MAGEAMSTSAAAAAAAPAGGGAGGGAGGATGAKPKKKICCACPETKTARDNCIVENGESACQLLIEAHKKCLRSEGFNVT